MLINEAEANTQTKFEMQHEDFENRTNKKFQIIVKIIYFYLFLLLKNNILKISILIYS